MKNQKGISLIALIITIIVIIILAAIVIGGVFNTPNDAKFANFCQEYDRVQTAIQLRYYSLYQKYAIDASLTEVPTHYEIYNEVATDTKATELEKNVDADGWVRIVDAGWAKLCSKPSGLVSDDDKSDNVWYLRLSDGKLAYSGFEKEEKNFYYTPSIFSEGTRSKLALGSVGEDGVSGGTFTLSPTGTLKPTATSLGIN